MRKFILSTIGIILVVFANSCVKSTTTNNINDTPQADTLVGNRVVMRIQKEGYFDRIYSKMATDTIDYPVELIKKEKSDFVTFEKFNSKDGATIIVDGASVTIPESSLMKSDGSDYDGLVNISVVYLSPSKNIQPLMPGADLMAITANGDTTPLISYGMINVEMTSENGENLQLKNGREATLKYPTPKGFALYDTIPLWYFNEDNGLWIEDGYSVKQGDEYIGYVKHFTWWNCDIKLDNGARIRVQLKNYPYPIASIHAGADSLVVSVMAEIFQTNMFPNRPFSIAGVQMPPLKPKGFLDTCIVFNKIVLKDVEGNKLPSVKFKINNVLYQTDTNGEYSVPLEMNKKTDIRFQNYETETITKENFDDNGICTVVCKPIREKGIQPNNRNIVAKRVESKGQDSLKIKMSEAEEYDDKKDTTEWDDKQLFGQNGRTFERIMPTNLSKNIKYPEECTEKLIQGVVWVSFYIETDGNVSDVKVEKSTQRKGGRDITENKDKEFELLEQEAVRCMKLEKFPSRSRRTRVTLPVTFRLSE